MQGNYNKKHLLGAWLICALGAIFYSYEYLLRISPSVMESSLREHFNLTGAGFGYLSAFYYYAYVPMQLPAGILLDRYGPRILLTFACFICVLGTFLFAASPIFWVAAMGRFMVGLGSAFAFVGVLKLATIWLPEDRLALVSGLTSALGTLGAMVGDNLLGLLVVQVGWVQTVNFTGFFGIALIFILWFGVSDKKAHQAHAGTIESFKRSMIDFRIIIRNKQMWINGFFGCLVYLPTTVFAELWGISYLRVAHGMTQEMAALTNSLVFFGFTLGAPLLGFISDKIKRRKPPMIIGASGAALIMIILLYVPGLSIITINILMFFLGLFYSAQCIVFAVSRELSPNEAAGTAMSMTNMIVMLGAMLFQPTIGHLLDMSLSTHVVSVAGKVSEKLPLYTVGDYQIALSIIPIGIIIAAILTLFLNETYADAAN